MALYRLDLQHRIATSVIATGFYVWTNVYYFEARTLDDRDEAVGQILNTSVFFHLNIVDQGPYRLATWPANIEILTIHAYTLHNTFLPGTPISLTNTIRLIARCQDGSLWYKRLRVPLRATDIAPEGRLTPTAHAYFSSFVAGFREGGYLTGGRGSAVGPITVAWDVYGWQLRHGTKRSARATLI